MARGTAQLLFGAADRKAGGLYPHVSMWFFEDDRHYWQVAGGTYDGVRWTPRGHDRAVSDALVMLLAITGGKSDPVPKALDEMAPGIEWRSGHVDVSTWRHYDTDLLDGIVEQEANRGEVHGKLVLSLFDGSSLGEAHLAPLARLGWDVDILAPTRVLRPAGAVAAAPPAVPQQRPRPAQRSRSAS